MLCQSTFSNNQPRSFLSTPENDGPVTEGLWEDLDMEVDQDPDLMVEDGSIIQTTEVVNGDVTVINPSMLVIDDGAISNSLHGFPDDIMTPEGLDRFLQSSNITNVQSPEESETDSDSEDDLVHAEPSHRRQVQVVIHKPAKPKYEALPYSTTRSGLVYDVLMRMHAELEPEEDEHHPEDPRRIIVIYEALAKAGLVHSDEYPGDQEYKLMRIQARHATKQEILLAHTKRHWHWVKSLPDRPPEYLLSLTEKPFDSIYANYETFLCATLSAGGAIEACRAVVAGAVKNSIAVIRPPGHHCESGMPSGFCFFNNVCVAARVCQEDFPEQCRKILILDWDVHHGNGVQEIFYNNPNILYISLHVYMNGQFYPGTDAGGHDKCGGDRDHPDAYGKNVNIPWSYYGMTDADYLHAFHEVVMPIGQEFNPDLVIVSAGFDAADGDELGKCHVTPAGYSQMTHMLMSLAKGKIAVCLEGGYNLTSIAKSALAVTRTLMGEPPERIDRELIVSKYAVADVAMVKRQQAKYWQSLFPREKTNFKDPAIKAERLHDVLRKWQSQLLFEEYDMTNLPIRRQSLIYGQSKSFDYQVIATKNHDLVNPLLVIFHDPPEVLGIPDPRTGEIEAHNTFITKTDVAKAYIEWACKHDMAVIDVNIPKHLTGVTDDYAESEADQIRSRMTAELAAYLWTNYIEVSDNQQVFFLGVGQAYLGLLDLLNNNARITQEDRITHIFSFLGETTLRPIKSFSEDNVGDWYHQHSTIFVAHNHGAWDDTRQRKLKKKYGNLVRSPQDSLSGMLNEHREDVFQLILDEISDWREEYKSRQMEASKPNAVSAASAAFNSALKAEDGGLGRGLGSPMQSPTRGTFGEVTSPVHTPAKMSTKGFFSANTPGRGKK